MSENNEITISGLAKVLGITEETARQIGKNGLLSQLLEKKGHPTTRCEDCRTAGQYTGDLEEDLKQRSD